MHLVIFHTFLIAYYAICNNEVIIQTRISSSSKAKKLLKTHQWAILLGASCNVRNYTHTHIQYIHTVWWLELVGEMALFVCSQCLEPLQKKALEALESQGKLAVNLRSAMRVTLAHTSTYICTFILTTRQTQENIP